jgi:hypothetical protein
VQHHFYQSNLAPADRSEFLKTHSCSTQQLSSEEALEQAIEPAKAELCSVLGPGRHGHLHLHGASRLRVKNTEVATIVLSRARPS